MKVSLNWIREYIDFLSSPKELADRLTLRGFNVEEIISRDVLPSVVLGKVVEKNKHPNADKLSCTRVDIGSEILSIVCGASNVAVGQLVPIAKVGAILPGNFEIKKAKIRGEESFGMICSKSELGFEKEKSSGIWELDSTKPHRLGQLLSEYLGGADTIFDIDVTSNRPDGLTLIGIAREVAHLEKKNVRLPELKITEHLPEYDIPVTIEDREGCPRYTARIIRGVKIGPSPDWLVKKIESVGLRTINNIVDITNFVMFECGQPLHAFDLSKIRSKKISVRKAKSGEAFTTLDGKSHKLTDDTVVICDGEGSVALGGVMGGQNSEISEFTTDVLLEAAYFEGRRIRRTAKTLGIQTDAANRFGRGINPDGTLWALNRAALLMTEIAGGKIAKGFADENHLNYQPRQILLTGKGIKRLLGVSVAASEVSEILTLLSCEVKNQGEENWVVIPPAFRIDLNIAEDLIEEIARIRGLNSIPDAPGANIHYHHEENKFERVNRLMKESLRESGFSEIVTNSMVSEKTQNKITRNEKEFVRLLNPISEDMAVMRTSLLPGVLEVIRGNLFKKNENLRLFEVGRTYHQSGNELPAEKTILVGCFVGNQYPIHWSEKPKAVDFFDLEGVIMQLAGKFKLASLSHNPYHVTDVWAANTIEFRLEQNGQEPLVLGHFGRIQDSLLKFFDIEYAVWAFELDISAWVSAATFKKSFSPISRFPAIERDLALIVDRTTPAGEVLKTLKLAAGSNLQAIDIFDVYQGEQVPRGKKSMAVSFRFQTLDRTLTEEEIDTTMNMILKTAGEKFGAGLRAE